MKVCRSEDSAKASDLVADLSCARGGSITVENTPFPLPSSGSDVVVGSNTIPLDSQATAIPTGSQVLQISQGPPSDLVVGGNTPAPGSAVTVNGITVSLPVLGTNAVVDGTSTSLGGAIRSGWRTLPTTDATAVTMGGRGTGNGSVVPFLGKALRNSMAGGHFWWTLAVILLGGVGIVGLI